MKNLPENVMPFRRTDSFTRDTVPNGLLKDHRTKEGVWGLIQVEVGALEYSIGADEVYILTPEKNGVVETHGSPLREAVGRSPVLRRVLQIGSRRPGRVQRLRKMPWQNTMTTRQTIQ